MQERILVTIILTPGCDVNHIAIALRGLESEKTLVIETPASYMKIDKLETYDVAFSHPDQTYKTFYIENDLDTMTPTIRSKVWQAYLNYCMCASNCADLTEWFMEKYAPTRLKSHPDSCCHYGCCGVFLPTFLQSCSLPDNIFERINTDERLSPLCSPTGAAK